MWGPYTPSSSSPILTCPLHHSTKHVVCHDMCCCSSYNRQHLHVNCHSFVLLSSFSMYIYIGFEGTCCLSCTIYDTLQGRVGESYAAMNRARTLAANTRTVAIVPISVKDSQKLSRGNADPLYVPQRMVSVWEDRWEMKCSTPQKGNQPHQRASCARRTL